MEKKVYVFDLEQLPNLHTATFMERDNPQNIRQFAISKYKNDMHEYYKFLQEEVAGLIGFSNVRYDYPLLHLFMALMKMISEYTTPDGLNMILHEESQRLIREEYTAISIRDTKIPQLDLFLIHHFDNKAKMTSLKAVQIAIEYPNVQDMPFEHTHYIKSLEEVEIVLDYNWNDVDSTREFYILSKKLVELRQKLGAKYKLNLLNHNDPKIGQEIFGREISKKTGIRYNVLKDMRTFRRYIDLGKCVLPSISFKSKEFNKILNFFKNKTIETTYKAFAESVIYKGFKYDYGTGGLHGCIESGVYEEDDKYIILDIDVQGYYPAIAITNVFYPRHLGRSFVEVYKEIVAMKNEASRTGDMVTKAGMKLSGNGVYGKSNDQYSLFYDPMYTMKVTVNGQLQLSMLAEDLVRGIKDCTVLQVNTDGITIRIPKNQHKICLKICSDWEEHTGLILEYAQYSKMVIKDVNNYLAITTDDKIKPKGAFEIIPMQNGAIAYNKNWSMRIVPKAIHAHYIDGRDIGEFIRENTNIYDFTIGFRSRGDWDLWATGLDKNVKFHDKQQKTIRYFMSRGGVLLTKENRKNGKVIALEANKTATVFNKYYEHSNFSDYGIDYTYYIKEANKIKHAVADGQLKLTF